MDIKKGLKALWSALFPTPEERAAQEKKERIARVESSLTYAVYGKAIDHEAQQNYNAVVIMGGYGVGMAPVFKDISTFEQKEAITKFSGELAHLGVSQQRIDAVIKTATDHNHKFNPNGYDYM